MEIDVTLLPFNFKETEKYNDKFLMQVRSILQKTALNFLIDIYFESYTLIMINLYYLNFFQQACASTKLNKEYSKHDFWSMVPKEELYERKLRCVFQYNPPETGCGDKGLNN